MTETYGSRVLLTHLEWTFTLDQDPIHTFTDDQKVDWLQGRVEMMLLVPLRDPTIRTRFNKEPEPSYDLNLGMMTLACCAIEALGRFYLGGSNKTDACPTCNKEGEDPGAGRCFRQFVSNYMPSFKPIADTLYGNFRSALAHSFAIPSGCLTYALETPFLAGNTDTPTMVDFERFIKSLDTGIEQYFSDLRKDPQLRERFLKHWNTGYKFWISASS